MEILELEELEYLDEGQYTFMFAPSEMVQVVGDVYAYGAEIVASAIVGDSIEILISVVPMGGE